jgi:uncharacterized protein YqjF (DUF2071 family)
MSIWSETFKSTAHRPYAHPDGGWTMHMSWEQLLFAHWPIKPEVMRERIASACGGWPEKLELDTLDGEAWLGVVPFTMARTGLWWWPTALGPHSFHELNVRTYVKHGGKPGVLFFSLDAASPMAVFTARKWFHLPYHNARMDLGLEKEVVRYDSLRTHRGSPPAKFRGTYGPDGNVYRSEQGTLERWLTERYCLYSVDRRNRVWRGEIHHEQWPLQKAHAKFDHNEMAACHGLTLPDTKPLYHYVKRIDVVAWRPEFVG